MNYKKWNILGSSILLSIAACGPEDPDQDPASDAGGSSNGALATTSSGGPTETTAAGTAAQTATNTSGSTTVAMATTGVDTDTDTAGPTTAGDTEADTDGVCGLPPQMGVDFNEGAFACCFEDTDCGVDMICLSASCEEGGEGICVGRPGDKMGCWADSDCSATQQCVGAMAYCHCTQICDIYADYGQCEDM